MPFCGLVTAFLSERNAEHLFNFLGTDESSFAHIPYITQCIQMGGNDLDTLGIFSLQSSTNIGDRYIRRDAWNNVSLNAGGYALLALVLQNG